MGINYEKMALTPQETAHILGLCLNSIYKLIKDGRLRAIKLDRKLLIPRAEIERFLHSDNLNPPTKTTYSNI